MKVAVSLPDPVFNAAEQLAAELGLPRSQLYSQALSAYLQSRGAEAVTARLNAVHGPAPEGLDSALAAAQLASVADEAW